METVGDVHNFGHKTTAIGNFVEKFRPVYWEWLFLSQDSPLRVFCQSEFGLSDPFTSFASLTFYSKKHEFELFQRHKIERLQIEKVIKPDTDEVFKIGQALGACSFFGLTDLHNENFMIGRNKDGKFIASPVDIEICFEEIEALSETHLVSSSTVSKNIVSIFDGMSISDDLTSTLIEGFLHSWNLLESKSSDIYHLLKLMNLNNIPIRLVITPTGHYRDYFLGNKSPDDFLIEEAIQLLRKDYPYFWTSLGLDTAYYFQSKDTPKEIKSTYFKNLLDNGNRFNLDNILKIRSQLKKISVLQIARALDMGKPSHISSSNNVHTVYFKDYIYIKTDNQGVKCKRLTNSSSFSLSASSLLAQSNRGNR